MPFLEFALLQERWGIPLLLVGQTPRPFFFSDPIVADALATAVGNEVRQEDPKRIEQVINRYLRLGAEGIVVVVGDLVGLGGRVPELAAASSPYELITAV